VCSELSRKAGKYLESGYKKKKIPEFVLLVVVFKIILDKPKKKCCGNISLLYRDNKINVKVY
jgi:hypothetical protein